MSYNYDVFLSYRHKPLDGEITQKTFNMIESYKLPKSLKEKGHDIKRAFRDTEELAVSRILTDTIDKALHSCNCLVVICSTDTPSSEWIDREVSMFIELGRPHKIFPLLISGDPESSFPPSLKLIPDIMDRVMDVRSEGNDVKEILKKEKTALLKVLAEATDVPYADLVRENSLRNRNRFLAKSAFCVSAMAIATLVSLNLMNLAQNYRDKAKAAETASMSVLQELTYGIPDKLSSVPGAYSKISGILTQNAQQINDILLLSTDKVSAEKEIASNYERYATALTVLGNLDEAISSEENAISLYEKNNDLSALASSYNNLGILLSRDGQYEKADSSFTKAMDSLIALDDSPTLSTVLVNASGNAIRLGDIDKAQNYYNDALKLLSSMDETYDTLVNKANLENNVAVYYYQNGNYAEAESHLWSSYENWHKVCEITDSIQNRNSQLSAISTLALSITNEGRYLEAEDIYLQAITFAEELAADAENLESAENLASLYNNCGINYNLQTKFDKAASCYIKAANIYQKIANTSNAPTDISLFADSCMNAGDNYLKQGNIDKSRIYFEKGLDAYSSIYDKLSDEKYAEYYSWYAYYELVHNKNYEKSLELSLVAYEICPENILVNNILGYTCLYNGYYDDCDQILSSIASLGQGNAQMILLDIKSQLNAGLESPHVDALLELISK